MRISARADYAVRAMVALAACAGDGLASADELAAGQAIPPALLPDILGELRSGGLISSKRGREGGFALARPPSDISVADVVCAIDGPLMRIRDFRIGDLPYFGVTAALTDVWMALHTTMRRVLECTTLADVAANALPDHVRGLALDYVRQETHRQV